MLNLFISVAMAPLMSAGIMAEAPTPAETAEVVVTAPAAPVAATTQASAPQPASDTVTTGVARGRDRLDSATSTSTVRQAEIAQLAPRSVGELLRAVPGLRSEAGFGEGNANISIRGLPIASTGAKFVQLQEDGLPILEFGDIPFATADTFLRADLSLEQVQVIRGGSASTFASNSPGGIINFISRTGKIDGGAVQFSTGLDYDQYRVDFDYGTSLSDTLRVNMGGFYRQGEGQRTNGFNEEGGQLKVNMTKDFSNGGYIRFYGKYLNDRGAYYGAVPVRVTGTNSDPSFDEVANFDIGTGSALSSNIPFNIANDVNNNLTRRDVGDGQAPVVKSFGVETQFDIAGWTISERFRFADISGHIIGNVGNPTELATAALTRLGGAGAVLSYATGPNAGQVITNPSALNGNGLVLAGALRDINLESLNNATNDLRISRVFDIDGNELTTTFGMYNSRQTINADWMVSAILMDVRGDGGSSLLNVRTAAGVPITQDGFISFGNAPSNFPIRSYRSEYTTNAPFASVNYRVGRLALGGSVRYDFGDATGSRVAASLMGGRIGTTTRDVNGDGVITRAETLVSIYPNTRPAPFEYDFSYLSYSASANFRISDPWAVFGRYSRGGRVYADRSLFTPYVSATTGQMRDGAEVDFVEQAEAGVKYRNSGLTLNLTGFWAKSDDTNSSPAGVPFQREYGAVGLEFEGGYTRGIFSIMGGATYTKAEILSDVLTPALEGNTPRNQADLVFQVTPQIKLNRFNVGAVLIGTTESFSADTNLLVMPGFVTTNAFVQYSLTDDVLFSVNANNVFDVDGFVGIDEASIPVSGVVNARPVTGRNISAMVRFNF